MKMIFQFWSAPPHLEASLEIAIRESLSGEQVFYFWGGDDVLFNEDNRPGKLGKMFVSQKPIHRAWSLIQNKFGNIFEFFSSWVAYDDVADVQSFYDYATVAELLNKRVDTFEIGRAALSSLAQVMQSDLTSREILPLRPMLNEIITSGLAVYFSVKKLLQSGRPDEVILFNGRFIHDAAVLAACRTFGIPFKLHERGASPDKFYVCGFVLHDAKSRYQEAVKYWDVDRKKGLPTRQLAKEYLDARIDKGAGGAWISFSAHFDRTTDFEAVKQNIGMKTNKFWVYFQSSNDEYAFIDRSLVKPTEWSRQEELVEFLAATLPDDTTLIVRIHPHMQKKNKADLESWIEFQEKVCAQSSRVIVIREDQSVNSYLLARHAKHVITCGSTLGMEAIYLGTKSICCGSAIWGYANGVAQVFDFQALSEALRKDEQVDPDVILPIAYWQATRGTTYSYYRPKDLFSGTFLGVDIFADTKYLNPTITVNQD